MNMKRIIISILCLILSCSILGCGDKTEGEIKNDKTNNVADKVIINNNEETDKIRDNYIESIQKLYPDIFLAGVNLYNDPHTVEIGVNYQGSEEETMKKMVEIFKSSEDFYKTQKIEKIYFSSMNDSMEDMGYVHLELQGEEYKIIDTTLK
ncbi:exported hypothetical protein [Clostridium neonatale]|nr:exported hypothetical protein [Clostridium neonatale]